MTPIKQKNARAKYAKSILAMCWPVFNGFTVTILPHDKAFPDKTRMECKNKADGQLLYMTIISGWQPSGRPLEPQHASLIVEDADGVKDDRFYGTTFFVNGDPYTSKASIYDAVIMVYRAFNGIVADE